MCDDCLSHPEPAPCPGSPPWPGAEPTDDPAAELAELIAAQQRDDADAHAPRHKREIPATDLNGRVDVMTGRIEHGNGKDWKGWHVLRERAVDHRCHPAAWQDAMHAAIDDAAAAAVRSGGENRAGRLAGLTVPLVLVGMGEPWDGRHAQYTPGAGLPCPGCGDGKLPPAWMCCVCSATRQDPRRWPAQAQEVKRRKAKRARRAGAKPAKGKPAKVS
jgi:hypothetical protein